MKGQTHPCILRSKLQRRLRTNMTDAERRLWSMLRGRQIEGCKFRRQHPYEHFILDFVCLDIGLVIEADGGQHLDNPTDRERDEALNLAGFQVLRFWNHDILQNSELVGEAIFRAVSNLKVTHPLPNPPPEGEGEKSDH
jgi:very-short-patch-repair endonuclease